MKGKIFFSTLNFTFIHIFILFVSCSLFLFTQEGDGGDDDFSPDSFLDLSGVDSEETGNEEEGIDIAQENITGNDQNQVSSEIFLELENQFQKNVIRDNNVYRVDLFQLKEYENLAVIKQGVDLLFFDQYVGFTFRNTSLSQLKKEQSRSLDSDFHNDLNQAFFSFYLLKADSSLNLGIGKIDLKNGSSYLLNSSDLLVQEGSMEDSRVGYYQTRLTFYSQWFDLSFSYIPYLETIYPEFRVDSFNGSETGLYHFSISSDYDVLAGQFSFLWNGEANLGLDVTLGIGDEIILYSENALSYRSIGGQKKSDTIDLPLGERGSLITFDRYIYQKEKFQLFDSILGISYTPASILNLIFEVRYLHSAIDWQREKDGLKEINDNREAVITASPQLAAEYQGVLGRAFSDFDPFNFQPLFLMFRVSRDDFLEAITSLDFNMESVLIYSPMDSTFRWECGLEWVSKNYLTIGTELDWNFGASEGVFTTVPNEVSWMVFFAINV